MRRLFPILVVVLASGLAAAGPASSDPATPAARVEAALQNIAAIDRPGRVGYATVWDGNKYVQCRRLPDRATRCEAAGASLQPSLRAALTGERLNRLAELGWILDPSFGNYVHLFPSEATTAQMAEHILRTLVEGYGAEVATLDIETTWVVDVPCPPRNGPTQNLAGMINDAPTMLAFAIHACSYTPEPAAPQKVASAAELIARSGARVAAEIQRLRINAQNHVYTVFDPGLGYVQCMPQTLERALYCEAQSPESWPVLATILTPERIATLHKAGYADPGRAPNFWKSYPFDRYSDTAIAAEILTILYDAYGYAGGTPLKVRTE